MALYEYQCARCGRKTEVIQRFSDPAPTKCPHCGGTLTKLLSSPAAHFKGSGFHATDYGRSGWKPGDSSKGKEEDSSKRKEGDGGATGDAGAGTKGDSAEDSSKEKKDSKDSPKARRDSGPGAATEAGAKREYPGSRPSSPPKKNTSTR
jgi:putative FmdB family regulatory protein